MRLVIVFGFISLFSISVLACDKPQVPDLPDPDTAVTPQMIKAKRELMSYMSAAETYLACVDDNRAHDAMVDEMERAAKRFNEIVSRYKVRMQKA